jgi:magnesium and cobalt transporter
MPDSPQHKHSNHSNHSQPNKNTSKKSKISEIFSFLKILKRHPKNLKELHALLFHANQTQLIDSDAYRMIEGVLNVSKLTVEDYMVPRSQMIVFELGKSITEILPALIESGHSRFPVIDEDKDNVVGILLAKDLLKYVNCPYQSNPVLDISMLRPARFVPESKHLDSLLKEFKSSREHLALVMDEYGGIAGLITIEDVLEQIVGNIEDEFDDEEEEHLIGKIGENLYLLQAVTPIEAFNDFFHVNLVSEAMDTMGGFVTQHLEHVPLKDEVLSFPPFEFTVKQADARRIIQLEVRVIPAELMPPHAHHPENKN